jgi:hypothetical protein
MGGWLTLRPRATSAGVNMKTVVDGPLRADQVQGLKKVKERVREVHEQFRELEEELRKFLPNFKEWTIRSVDLKPVWWNFDELYKADYHGTDEELYEVIVSPDGKLQVTRL